MPVVFRDLLKCRFRSAAIKCLIFLVLITATIFISDFIVKSASDGKLFSDMRNVPYNKTGLLLGTGKYLRSGNVNPYYSCRIKAAADLIRAGKIKYIIISGDNSRKDYNEPGEMKSDLVRSGVDSTCIFLDFAGFRTFDSMVRAREIFGQTEVTVISQQFHNERAIYIASCKGINAIGFNACDVGKTFGLPVLMREKFARVRVLLDIFLGQEPKFYGEKITIP
jgi:SanA protein